jgi:AmmeMemoRadiSam system protein A
MAVIDPIQRAKLLTLARASLDARVRGGPLPSVPPDLQAPASGVFVTIHCDGALRGCLGTLDPREPLGSAVQRLAAEVGHADYRFHPIRPHEVDDVTIDLSVLTPPERVADPSDVVVGRDGLIVQLGGRKGLLLPQVAPEHGWDRETYLSQTCVKAGLPSDAWRNGAEIFRFEAEVFGEDGERPRE